MIYNVIKTFNIVIIKPCFLDIQLYIKTSLFLICSDFQNKSKYILLGYINDIFGSIKEPMYFVTIKCNATDILNIYIE